MFLLASLLTARAEVVLRNDTNYDDTFESSDAVVWLDYPECAVSVLTPDEADLPLSLDTVQVFLGSSRGAYDGQDTMAEVALKILDDGEDPTYGGFDWGPEAFYVTVSTTQLNELDLVDKTEGMYPLQVTGGRVAVYVCPPDPETGFSWPGSTSDTHPSGIVLSRTSPSEGTWIYYSGLMVPMEDVGYSGAWVIRAVDSDASGGGGGGDDDTGSPASGDLVLDSITPSSAYLGEAVDVALVGAGFTDGASVIFGGMQATNVSVAGDAAITATSPSALPAGTHDVMVQLSDGSSSTLSGAFTVIDAEEGDEPGGCGCAAAGGSATGWLLLPLLLVRRRR